MAGTYFDATYKNVILRDKPSLYWPLDGTNGATDQSGNARNGTGAGGVTIGGFAGSPVTDISQSTQLDSLDDEITSTYAAFPAGAVKTFEGWYFQAVSVPADIIMGGTGAVGPFLQVQGASKNDVAWVPATGGGNVSWAAALPGTGVWYHWALAATAGLDATLYVNGALVSTQTIADNYSASAGNFEIGNTLSQGNFAGGNMAHVAVYDYHLHVDRLKARVTAATA